MPVRALRRKDYRERVKAKKVRVYESNNARKGIKTNQTRHLAVRKQPHPYESNNARKGIKTNGALAGALSGLTGTNQIMPVRALRLFASGL